MRKGGLYLVMVILLMPLAAWGHRLSLFLDVKGVAIEGYAYFSNGSPARNSPVKAYGPGAKVIWEGKTDREGKFQFFVKGSEGPIKVVVNALDGHKAVESLSLQESPPKSSPPPRGEIKTSQILAGLGWIMGIFGTLMFWLSYRHES